LSETALTRALALGSVLALVDLADVDLSREFYLAVPQERTLTNPAKTFVNWILARYAAMRRTDLLQA
jgi:DNA-binding transcriptional LysR family regulator